MKTETHLGITVEVKELGHVEDIVKECEQCVFHTKCKQGARVDCSPWERSDRKQVTFKVIKH
jgi:hypothetical protein